MLHVDEVIVEKKIRIETVKFEISHLISELSDLLIDTVSFELMHDAVFPPCGHAISNEQVTQWLRNHDTCPTCNTVINKGPFPSDDKVISIVKAVSVAKEDDLSLLTHLQSLLTCSLTQSLMTEPVTAPCGHTCDKSAITKNVLCSIPNCKKEIIPIALSKNILLGKILELYKKYEPLLLKEVKIESKVILDLITLNKNDEIIDIFKKCPKQLNFPLVAGQTILHLAIKENKINLVLELLKCEHLDVNKRIIYVNHNDGETPLHLALMTDSVDIKIVAALIRHANCDLNICVNKLPPLLHLLSHHSEKNIKWRTSAILLAVSQKFRMIIVDQKVKDNLLMQVIRSDDLDIFTVLLSRKDCDVNYKNANGESALLVAARLERVAFLNKLLTVSSIDFECVDNRGDTLLHIALRNINLNDDIFHRILMNSRSSLNHQNKLGETALIIAVKNNQVNKVKLLITQANIDITLKNNEGQSALDIATRDGHDEIVKLLNQPKIIIPTLLKNEELVQAAQYIIKMYAAKMLSPNNLLQQVCKCLYDSKQFHQLNELLSHLLQLSLNNDLFTLAIEILKTKPVLMPIFDSCRLFIYKKLVERNYPILIEELMKLENLNLVTGIIDPKTGDNLLTFVARHGRITLFNEVLHLNGQNINAKSITNGESALYIACNIGKYKMVRLLLSKNNIDCIAKARDGSIAYDKAKIKNHLSILNLYNKPAFILPVLLHHKNFITMADIVKKMFCIKPINCDQFLQSISKYFPNNHEGGLDFKTLLTKLLSITFYDKVFELFVGILHNYSDLVNLPIIEGKTAIHLAIIFGDNKLLEQLLALKSVDTTLIDNHDNTILMLAVKHCNLTLFKQVLLLSLKTINHQNKLGESALIIAAQENQAEKVNLLLQQFDIDITLKNNKSQSALDNAILHSHEAIVKILNEPQVIIPLLLNKAKLAEAAQQILKMYQIKLLTPKELLQKVFKFIDAIKQFAQLNELLIYLLKLTLTHNLLSLFIEILKTKPELIEALNWPRLSIYLKLVEDNQFNLIENLMKIEKLDLIKGIIDPLTGDNLLTFVARHGGITLFNQVMEMVGQNINAKSIVTGESALYIACDLDKYEIANLLLNRRNIDFLAKSNNGSIAFDRAKKKNYYSIVQLFLKPALILPILLHHKNFVTMADIIIKMFCIKPNDIALYLQVISNYFPETHEGDKDFKNLLIELLKVSIKEGLHEFFIGILQLHPYLVNSPIKDGKAAIHLVISTCNVRLLEQLLSLKSIDVNLKIINDANHDDLTPLQYAATIRLMPVEMLETLIIAGAKINITADGNSILMLLLHHKNNKYQPSLLNKIQLLIRSGQSLSLDAVDIHSGNDVLIKATRNYDLELYPIIAKLCKNQLHHRNRENMSALDVAIKRQNLFAIQTLFHHYSDYSQSKKVNLDIFTSALRNAIKYYNKEVFPLILEFSKYFINNDIESDMTPLYLAAKLGKEGAVVQLLNRSEINPMSGYLNVANAKYDNTEYYTPSGIAKIRKNFLIAHIIDIFIVAKSLLEKSDVTLDDLKINEPVNVQSITEYFPSLWTRYSAERVNRTHFLLDKIHYEQETNKYIFCQTFFAIATRDANLKLIIDIFSTSKQRAEILHIIYENLCLRLKNSGPIERYELFSWSKQQECLCQYFGKISMSLFSINPVKSYETMINANKALAELNLVKQAENSNVMTSIPEMKISN